MLGEAREALKSTDTSLLTIVLVLTALYFGREVFIPLALAGLLSFLLVPVAALLERWGIRRAAAALLVVGLSLAAVAALGWVMLGQVYTLAVGLPQYQQNIAQKIDALHLHSPGRLSKTIAMLSEEGQQLRGEPAAAPSAEPALPEISRPRTRTRLNVPPEPNKDQLAAQTNQPLTVRVEPPEESVIDLANRTLTPLIHPLATTFVVVVFLAFMLVGREDLRDRGIRLAGRGRLQVTTSAIEDASNRVGRYLRMQVVVNLTFGSVAGLCLWAIGVPNPLLWAILITIFRFVPYIGILMASAGPLLLATAASAHWGPLIWTAATLFVLELIAGNVVEPLLYGSSTGLSPIAVLIATIFWTLIWGLPGLLLSTPLTVCLVVIGKQVPQLHYLDVLLGDETALPPAERLYQRMLASNTREVRAILEALLATHPREQVFDSTVIPALTLLEESRHADDLNNTRAEEILESIEELIEDIVSRTSGQPGEPASRKFIACIPAHDFADEIVCQLASHILTPAAIVRVFSAEASKADIVNTLETVKADAICVIGIPPSSLRHIRLRCSQIRSEFPDVLVIACVLSEQCDLSNIRSRIPTEDAQHVVCSLQLMQEYVASLLNNVDPPDDCTTTTDPAAEATEELTTTLLDMQNDNVFDESEEGVFQHLATNLARSFDAPIALLLAADGRPAFWEAQCGLPDDAVSPTSDVSICAQMIRSESILIISETAENPLSANEQFFRERGIRFYAGAPIKSHDGVFLGALCVLDTRPRQINDKHKDMLLWIAEVVTASIELQTNAAPYDESRALAATEEGATSSKS